MMQLTTVSILKALLRKQATKSRSTYRLIHQQVKLLTPDMRLAAQTSLEHIGTVCPQISVRIPGSTGIKIGQNISRATLRMGVIPYF